MKDLSDSFKLAQSASALGAGLLGFGVGAKWGASLDNTILLVVLIAGTAIHVTGMYIMQMKEERVGHMAKLLWVTAWISLLALVGLFIYLAI